MKFHIRLFTHHSCIYGLCTIKEMSGLDDFLAAHRLDRRDLQRVCSKVHRDEFSKRINRDWKAVGTVLGLSQEQLDAIDAEYESEEQKKTVLFDQWSEMDGEKATYLKLAEMLFAGQLNLLQELCLILTDTTPHTPASLGQYCHINLICWFTSKAADKSDFSACNIEKLGVI